MAWNSLQMALRPHGTATPGQHHHAQHHYDPERLTSLLTTACAARRHGAPGEVAIFRRTQGLVGDLRASLDKDACWS
jgi:hypothetical protein